MRVSAQEEYGLRCLMQIARAWPGGARTITSIAAAEGLTPAYVAKLLALLRQAGLIESERGRTGGYRLTASPAETRLGALLLALGEPLFDAEEYCDRHAGTTNDCCVHIHSCSLRALWQTMEQWMRGVLNQLTLEDLLQSEGRIGELLHNRLAATQNRLPIALPVLEDAESGNWTNKARKKTVKTP